jgi:hypothetical protein
MAMKTKVRSKRKAANSYYSLIDEFALTSIKSEDQLEVAQAMIDCLVTKGALDDGELLYLDALSDLVGAYEDVN